VLIRILISICVISLTSCTQHVRGSSDNILLASYQAAIKDAEIAEPDEIVTNLVAIVPSNKKLIWKGEGKNRSVLMVTWTAWAGYDDSVGKTIKAGQKIWTTVAPAVKTFCNNLSDDEIKVSRLEQLLGLPLGSGKIKFVELWVKPIDLFRPSPDPAISDHEAEINFPDTGKLISISDEYKSWFNKLKANSYKENGYPWTRLGYTYDWGNPDSEVGLSEFVIEQGAQIEVHTITITSDYCNS